MATERPDDYEKELKVALDRFFPGLAHFLMKKGIPDKQLAESLVINVFTKLWRMNFKFNDPDKANTLESYLFISVNTAFIDYLREKKKSKKKAERAWAALYPDNESTLEAELLQERTLLRIYQFIKTLDPVKQQLFQLVHKDGLSVHKAASLLGIPPRTAANWNDNIIETLKQKFGNQDLSVLLGLLSLLWDLYKN
ncbi:MAG TPA: sigma-70 family RNA polymerase sigma factor [Puia sp.]|jgi:RNA polymerase sigma factor (sigma-70 family)